jgi:peptide/nickel transport system ATP-binding protein
MYAGKMIEHGSARDIYYKAQHPYTWGLLRSISRLDDEVGSRLTPIKGLPPSLINVPPGCSFHPRCPYAFDRCREEVPVLSAADGAHSAACHLAMEDRDRIFAEEVKR